MIRMSLVFRTPHVELIKDGFSKEWYYEFPSFDNDLFYVRRSKFRKQLAVLIRLDQNEKRNVRRHYSDMIRYKNTLDFWAQQVVNLGSGHFLSCEAYNVIFGRISNYNTIEARHQMPDYDHEVDGLKMPWTVFLRIHELVVQHYQFKRKVFPKTITVLPSIVITLHFTNLQNISVTIQRVCCNPKRIFALQVNPEKVKPYQILNEYFIRLGNFEQICRFHGIISDFQERYKEPYPIWNNLYFRDIPFMPGCENFNELETENCSTDSSERNWWSSSSNLEEEEGEEEEEEQEEEEDLDLIGEIASSSSLSSSSFEEENL